MKRKVLLQTVALVVLVGGGMAFGWWLGQTTRSDASPAGGAPAAHDADHEHEEEEHVHLTREAYENLQLRLGKVAVAEYTRTIRIPGEVVEIPGRSSRSVAAPVTGIVDRLYVETGQVVPNAAPLLEMEITDEQLIAGQVGLLDVSSRLDVAQSELDRLAPLAESGTIAGRRRLELQYEAQQLQAQLQARVQELRLRGLSTDQIAGVRENRELVQRIVVRLPTAARAAGPSPAGTDGKPADAHAVVRPASSAGTGGTSDPAEDAGFTVEELGVHPGMSVARGDELCRLADHRWLFIRGEAFEEDIASIARLRDRGWSVVAEFGHQHADAHQHLQRVEDLHVDFVDNHVDPQTRTFRFYLRLGNDAAREHRNHSGVLFREWQYKPGQLAHLFVPVEKWPQQFVLPREAVVEEGPSAFVFRRHHEVHDEDAHELHAHAHPHPREADDDHDHEPFIEFEPVEVRLLYKDSRQAVIAEGGLLRPGDEIALNRAYQLRLAMKLQSGGGGHQHQHDH